MAKDDNAAPATPEVTAPPDDGLIAMRRGDDVLRVHPSCVAAHAALGWSAAAA